MGTILAESTIYTCVGALCLLLTISIKNYTFRYIKLLNYVCSFTHIRLPVPPCMSHRIDHIFLYYFDKLYDISMY